MKYLDGVLGVLYYRRKCFCKRTTKSLVSRLLLVTKTCTVRRDYYVQHTLSDMFKQLCVSRSSSRLLFRDTIWREVPNVAQLQCSTHFTSWLILFAAPYTSFWVVHWEIAAHTSHVVNFVFYLSLSLVYGKDPRWALFSVTYHKLIWSSSRKDGEETLFVVFLADSRHTLMSFISIGRAGESMATSRIPARSKIKFQILSPAALRMLTRTK